jgi:antitoxin component YwqK of YwqJK toxin-antitoxin module
MRRAAESAVHILSVFFLMPFVFSILCSCDGQVSSRQIVVRNGIVYEIGSTKPFSGFVTGKDRKGYQGAVRYYKKHYRAGVLDGKSEYRYANKRLEGIEPYKDGKIHGMVSRYYDNGQIRSRVHFVNGLRGGSKGEMFWSKSGKLIKG